MSDPEVFRSNKERIIGDVIATMKLRIVRKMAGLLSIKLTSFTNIGNRNGQEA